MKSAIGLCLILLIFIFMGICELILCDHTCAHLLISYADHILVATIITERPHDIELTEEYLKENTEIIYPCKATSDDATAITLTW